MKYKLKEIGNIITGKTPNTSETENFSYNKSKYLFITPRDMNINSKYIKKTERYLTDFVTKKMKHIILEGKSICISCIGSDMGKVYIIDGLSITNQQINSITNINEICNPEYLYYYFKDKKGFFKSIAGGSTMPILKKSDFEDIIVDLPERYIQDKIVKILNSLDEKIELNNHINNNLYEIVIQMYNNLFLNLEEWKEVKLNELGNISSGKRPNIKLEKGMYHIIGANGKMGYTSEYNFDKDIIITGRVGTLGVVKRYYKKIWASDNTLIIETKYKNYIENYLKTLDYSSLNRGSTQPLLTQTDLKNQQILFNDGLVSDFEFKAEKFVNKIRNNEEENEILEQLRDTLLPKLLNGEINLDKVEL